MHWSALDRMTRQLAALLCVALAVTIVTQCMPASAAQPPGAGGQTIDRSINAASPGPRPTGLSVVLDGSSDANWKQAIANPSISGAAVQIHWADIEPSQGSEDWSKLDELFALADASHKWVQLLIFPGFFSPAWALKNVKTDKFAIQYGPGQGTVMTLPMPWDSVYLNRWFSFVKDVSNRYGSRSSFRQIGAAGPTSVSVEFTLPQSPSDLKQWQADGYTQSKYIDAYKTTFAAYAADFPNQYISLAKGNCIPIDDKGKIVSGPQASCDQTIVTDGMSSLGNRFGLQISDVHAGPGPRGFSSAHADHFVVNYAGQILTGMQMETSAQKSSRVMGAAGDPALALSRSIQQSMVTNSAGQHVDYLQIYATDVVAPDMQTVLSEAAAEFKILQPTKPPRTLPKY